MRGLYIGTQGEWQFWNENQNMTKVKLDRQQVRNVYILCPFYFVYMLDIYIYILFKKMRQDLLHI
jgi:hypothetical protein